MKEEASWIKVRRLAREALPGVALGIVGAGALALMGVTGAGLGLAVAPIALYHRVDRDGSFDNDTRRRIFEIVRVLPGSCIADIAGKVGVSHSTASYHLEKLSGFKLITATADGNKVRYFVNGGQFTEEERRVLSALDNAETRRVLQVIMNRPRCYRAELTEVLGVSSPTVNWHLDRLIACNLVSEEKQGRSRLLIVDRPRVDVLLGGLLSKLEHTGYDASGLQDLLLMA